MKIRRICDMLILVTGILAVLSLGIVFTQNRTLGDIAENIVADMLEDSVQITEQEDSIESLFADILRGDAGDVTKALGDKIQDLTSGILPLYKAGLFLPAMLAAMALVLVWVLPQEWRYLVSFGIGIAGTITLLGSELLAIPLFMYGCIEDTGILKWVGDVVKVADLRKMVISAAGVYYWIGLGLLVVMTLLCIAGFFVKDETETVLETGSNEWKADRDNGLTEYLDENRATEYLGGDRATQYLGGDRVTEYLKRPEDTPPAIRCIAGLYAGGKIPVQAGEVLVLGRDSKVCNLVLEGENVSRCHCSVEFDKKSKQYIVKDFSTTGTYTNDNVRLRKGEYEALKRKSILVLGSDENIFMLE